MADNTDQPRERQSIHVRLPLSLLEQLKERATVEECSVNTLMVATLAASVAKGPPWLASPGKS